MHISLIIFNFILVYFGDASSFNLYLILMILICIAILLCCYWTDNIDAQNENVGLLIIQAHAIAIYCLIPNYPFTFGVIMFVNWFGLLIIQRFKFAQPKPKPKKK